jgi:hypothetical protein
MTSNSDNRCTWDSFWRHFAMQMTLQEIGLTRQRFASQGIVENCSRRIYRKKWKPSVSRVWRHYDKSPLSATGNAWYMIIVLLPCKDLLGFLKIILLAQIWYLDVYGSCPFFTIAAFLLAKKILLSKLFTQFLLNCEQSSRTDLFGWS